MDIHGLDHIVLTVRDVAATATFYARVLGPRVETDADGRTALQFGPQKINLHPAEAEYVPHAAAPTPGSGDLCFLTREPVEAVAARLRRDGVAVEVGPVPQTGARGPMTSIYVRDPDGNLVEIARYDGGRMQARPGRRCSVSPARPIIYWISVNAGHPASPARGA